MPTTVRKAEIDARNGLLIRELNDAEAQSAKLQQAAARKNAAANVNADSIIAPVLDSADIYVSEVPAEYRRVELFVSGTVPNKALLPTADTETVADVSNEPKPSPTATPFTTWQEEQGETTSDANSLNKRPTPQKIEVARTITVMICPLTGMRATSNCPNKQPEIFDEGKEPKDFCTFHVNPR
jgi:hypothetical protein